MRVSGFGGQGASSYSANGAGTSVHANSPFEGSDVSYRLNYNVLPPGARAKPVKKLQVDDALSYLEQVRKQFHHNPDVYNDFLEVMKEFKSHAIDTQGVIRRVSRLFSDHPSLITGFNTFLPPGFEVRVNGHVITIIEPNGVTNLDIANGKIQEIRGPVPSADAKPAVASISTPSKPASVPQQAASEETIEEESSRPAFLSAQPIQFHQAVDYLNKIKERFSDRLEIYQEFLNILARYQGNPIDTGTTGRQMSESEVYRAVSKLFDGEQDLMRDFKSFLPDACIEQPAPEPAKDEVEEKPEVIPSPPKVPQAKKRPPETPKAADVAAKKSKVVTQVNYDLTIDQAIEGVPMMDFVFFDKVKKLIRCEQTIKNFFRCLMLYNQSLVNKYELVELVGHFISRWPDLFKEFKSMVQVETDARIEKKQRGPPSHHDTDIDFATCKVLGVSYRCLPADYNHAKASGRTPLCDSVLNDWWVSVPSWSSEDTTVVSSKKNQFEEFMYRTEDERFEVDIIIEVNSAAITSLEQVRKKIESMKAEAVQNYRLDENYGCRSPTLMARAVKKIYGEHATQVLDGLRNNPAVAVTQVLQRMREKDEEWRKVREQFNQVWREQTDVYHNKSLDAQVSAFRNNDVKNIRSKNIIQQLENSYDERLQRMEIGGAIETGPHMVFEYPADLGVIYDANEILIHHVKRQQAISKKEKLAIKKLLRQLIPDLFRLPEEETSDDEEEDVEEDSENEDEETEGESSQTRKSKRLAAEARRVETSEKATKRKIPRDVKRHHGHLLFFGTNYWIIFLRLHHMLCQRLSKFKQLTEKMVTEYRLELAIREHQKDVYDKYGPSDPRSHEENAVDVHLGLRAVKKPLQNPEGYYTTTLQEIKNLLDGQTDSNTFEETMRSMYGTQAYVLFTMDKVLTTITRQMQNFLTEDVSSQSVELFQKYLAERPDDTGNGNMAQIYDDHYEKTAQKLMVNQNCFKTYFIEGARTMISVELIDTESTDEDEDDNSPPAIDLTAEFSNYLRNYVTMEGGQAEGLPEDYLEQLQKKPVFMMRNARAGRFRLPSTKPPPAEDESQPGTSSVSSLGDTDAPKFHIREGLKAIFSQETSRATYLNGTSDVLIRISAPGRAKKNFREQCERRRERFRAWLESKEAENSDLLDHEWLPEGCEKVFYHHPVFEFLTYTKYHGSARPSATPDGS